VREHSLEAVRDVFELDAARRALRWNALRRHDAAKVDALADKIGLAARVYRHARSLARDVADAHVRDAQLAAATRDLADATDRALTDGDPEAPLGRAATSLEAPFEGDARIVAAQLRQLHADVSGAMRRD
jgi:hypothetical protein